MNENAKSKQSIINKSSVEGYVKVTGGKIWYKIIGINMPGIPLLLIHGGPGASHDYLEPIGGLANERPVIFYDQLGCGNSDNPNDTSFWCLDRFVDELQQLIHSLGLEKVHILGQSWGTSIAVEYVVTKNPPEVESLILSGSLISTNRWINDQKANIEHLPVEIKKVIRDCENSGYFESEEYQNAMMVFYKKHVCRLDNWPECLTNAFEKLNLSQYNYMWGPSEFTVTGTLKNYERVNELKNIDLPVLFTCGEYDESSPASNSFFHKNLRGSQLHVFKDASHEHHIEKTDEYLNVVRKFLSELENK
jgi:proline iminopeptidase